jgi:hypothetical protein
MGTFGALANVVHETEINDDDDKEDTGSAVAAAARRVVDDAGSSVRACVVTRAPRSAPVRRQPSTSRSPSNGDGHARFRPARR